MRTDDALYFRLFANCIPVKGSKRSIVCDLQRNRYRFIPNQLFEILKNAEKLNLDLLKKKYDHSLDKGIDKYFKLLQRENWGFYTDSPESFPKLECYWDSSSTVTNAILDFDKLSNYNWKKAVRELDNLRCEAIQLRFFDLTSRRKLISILQEISLTDIHYIELQIQALKGKSDFYKLLLKTFPRLRRVVVSKSHIEKTEDFSNEGLGMITYTRKNLNSESHCGVVSPSLFVVNVPHFTEAVNFNSCLNRKVGIDKLGHVKNCPSIAKFYGHVDSVSIAEVAHSGEFQKMWNINKDQIDICRVCEFRYICTDCRAYVSESDKLLSKPLKCGYNPFEGKWSIV